MLHEPILKQLATAACGEHAERVVEIGPGRGAFTKVLLPLVDELHVVEVDRTLVEHLNRKFSGEDKLHIHHSDVLQTDLSQWGPAVIAGNLPYYITSPILEKFLAMDARFPLGIFLVQLEVANRLAAKPKTRDFGYLSIRTQLFCDVELVFRVEPKFFNPPPQVDSAVVRLKRKQDVPLDANEIAAFAGLCFAHKRKTLRNNLRAHFGPAVENQPEGNLRAEQLSLGELTAFYRRLIELTGKR